MSDKDYIYHIVDLIYKSIAEQLGQTEREELDLWLSDERNYKLYQTLIDRGKFERNKEIYETVDKDRAYQLFEKRLEERRAKTERFKKRYRLIQYAAIFIIALSVSGYFLFYGREESSRIEPGVEIVNTIKPGYEKATLILADGKEINLEKNKDQFVMVDDLVEVENKDNLLIYRGKSEAKSDVVKKKYNTLHIPKGGVYKLALPDGSTVLLNSSSSLKFPESFSEDTRVVELEGEGYFDIVRDTSRPFIVKTAVRDITVLGTQFDVSAYIEDNFFTTTLVEGSVKLDSPKDEVDDGTYLSPGEQIILDMENGTANVKKVNAQLYTAWKDGKFYFEKERLDNILVKLGRWYDFDFTFTNPSLKKRLFIGVAKRDYSLHQILDMIARTSKINYQIKHHKNRNAYEVIISEN
ncbi:FecR family protein [Sinomicrobium sp.]